MCGLDVLKISSLKHDVNFPFIHLSMFIMAGTCKQQIIPGVVIFPVVAISWSFRSCIKYLTRNLASLYDIVSMN